MDAVKRAASALMDNGVPSAAPIRTNAAMEKKVRSDAVPVTRVSRPANAQKANGPIGPIA